MSRRPVIEVHIDSLVIEGVSRAEGDRIGDGLRTELARVLTGDHGGGTRTMLGAAQVVGAEVARSVGCAERVEGPATGSPRQP